MSPIKTLTFPTLFPCFRCRFPRKKPFSDRLF
nr:MAG TPA: hypothetical protein [Caudoviricetes sp.]